MLLGVIWDGQALNLDDVPYHVLPPEVVAALRPDLHRHDEAIHLSTLGICPHKVKRERSLGYYLPRDACYRLIKGKSWDCLIDKYRRKNALYHHRFWRDLGGVPITGEPDLIDLDLRTIEDYKAPTYDNTKGTVYPSYSFQLNGYVWLTETVLEEGLSLEGQEQPLKGIKIEGLFLQTMGPKTPIRIPVPLWPPRVREHEIQRRLDTLLTRLQSDNLDPCDDTDCIFCRQEAIWVDLPHESVKPT